MTGQKIISIITPSFNQGAYIERTIRSVLQQEVNFPFEYIIVDGGSTDETPGILKKYSERIQWISEKDRGQSDALNKGISMAKGGIIGYLNSDDIYLQGTLQKVADQFALNPETKWLYGMAGMINDQDAEIRKWISWYKKISSRAFNYRRLLRENYISQPAVFFKKQAFDLVGGFDPGLHYAMDYDLWLRLARVNHPLVIKDDLAAFRMHEQSKSSLNFKNLFTEQYQVHQRYDQNQWLLFKHRLTIRLIQTIYRLL